jgi:putative flippase GtrA
LHSFDEDFPGNSPIGKQFSSFAACGAVATLAHYILLVSLVQQFASPPIIASSAGFLLGATVNYVLNYHFTFRSTKPHRKAMWKFYVAASIGALINAAFMTMLIFASLHYLLSQVIATTIVLLWSFIINRSWIFGDGHG